MTDRKDLNRYYGLETDSRLHETHRLVIKSFNRILNGDPEKKIPGLRNVVVGAELERVSTSIALGIYTVSDPNPGFEHVTLKQENGGLTSEVDFTESVLVSGNILIVGPPGGAKTLLARTFASLCGLSFAQVKMTPDLTPRDLIATTTLEGDQNFTYLGPVFRHILLADEVNRATPKTQSALLERMSSGTVTYKERGREVSRVLPKPCFTIATMNPIEQEGTFPLPEAQLDRFLGCIRVPLPSAETMRALLKHVTLLSRLKIGPCTHAEEILQCRDFIFSEVEVPEEVENYIVRLIQATYDPFVYPAMREDFQTLHSDLGARNLIELPPNSRAVVHLLNVSKTLASLAGSRVVRPEHVKKRFYEVVNHRFVLQKSVSFSAYGGKDAFIRLLVVGNQKRKIRGLLDVVPVES